MRNDIEPLVSAWRRKVVGKYRLPRKFTDWPLAQAKITKPDEVVKTERIVEWIDGTTVYTAPRSVEKVEVLGFSYVLPITSITLEYWVWIEAWKDWAFVDRKSGWTYPTSCPTCKPPIVVGFKAEFNVGEEIRKGRWAHSFNAWVHWTPPVLPALLSNYILLLVPIKK